MPKRSEIRDKLDVLTDTISNRIRTIAVGVLAFSWAFLIEGTGEGSQGDLVRAPLLVGPIALSALALVLDLAQYIIGYRLNLVTLRKMGREDDSVTTYDTKHILYRARFWSFNGKICLGTIAALWLVGILTVVLTQQVRGT